MPKVLIVEDEHSMSVALKDGFTFEGYDVVLATDGEAALALAKKEEPDLVVLDVMLPKMNGHDVCKQLRQEGFNIPIIMLSARSQEIDKVLGLKLGADDYVTKPFSFMELMARVEAVLRRTSPRKDQISEFSFGNISVDLKKRRVCKNGKKVDLSVREFRLLKFFIEHEDEVVERDTLLDSVWDHDNPPLTRTVDMHMAKLRKKLEDNPSEPRHFITVHRVGYTFTAGD